MTDKTLSIREAVSRYFPGGDNGRADELIQWLDHCGYAIVDKEVTEQATLVPRFRVSDWPRVHRMAARAR